MLFELLFLSPFMINFVFELEIVILILVNILGIE